MLLERTQGYGASFNNLYLLEDKIKKEAKNTYGISKIQKEIIFYKFVQEHKCLPMPEFIESTDSSYTMRFIKAAPLFHIFPQFTTEQKETVLETIYTYLSILHKTKSITVSKELYKKSFEIEMVSKLIKRYDEIKDILNEFKFVKSVNGVLIQSFDIYLGHLSILLDEHIESKKDYIFSPIHGDCQFNNILYNNATSDVIFIDPRGYFGDNDLYGPPEYDFAKVLFALSGYDAFDAREVTCLDISGSNITLEIPTLVHEPLAQTKNRFLSQLVVSIWMGNAHCFKDNKFKTAYSYFIAMYYASLYL